jgi:hypothetical protein
MNEYTFEERIQHLQKLTSKADWNQVDNICVAIPPTDWNKARSFYMMAKKAILPAVWKEPFISPCADGSIHLYWRLPRGKINVEYLDKKWHLHARFSSGTNIVNSDEMHRIVTQLVGCFMEMFQRTKPGEDRA